MIVTVTLTTSESIEGIILEETDQHIVFAWANAKKVSVFAKQIIKSVRFIEVDIY